MPHTPGPWEYNPYGAIKGGPLVEFSRGFAREQLALVCVRQHTPDDLDTAAERNANARLIAAAPELLAALKTALAMLENGDFRNGVEEYGVDEGMVGANKLIDEITALIAKAEGTAMTAAEIRALVEDELSEEYRCICPYGGRGEGGCSCGSDRFDEVVDRIVEERLEAAA